MTWPYVIKKCTTKLVKLSVSHFRGWGPKDPSVGWLKTLKVRQWLMNSDDRHVISCLFKMIGEMRFHS